LEEAVWNRAWHNDIVDTVEEILKNLNEKALE